MLANALTRRWPKGERLIAEALGVAPEKSGLRATADIPPAQPDTEAAPHFVYPIRDNPLSHKNSFLLSASFVTHEAPAWTKCFMI